MIDNSKRISDLSVSEFTELLNGSNSVSNQAVQYNSRLETKVLDIIYIGEVAFMTNYKKSTIYSKVSRGEMPVISKRRPLTFSRTKINNWMKAGRPKILI